MRKTGEQKEKVEDESKPKFQGQGQTLRGGLKRKGGEPDVVEKIEKGKEADRKDPSAGGGQKLGGRTLRDTLK